MHVEDNHRTKGLIRLTMACNERCSFCNVPMEDYPVKTATREQIQRELTVFFEEGCKSLAISGGEPTLLRERLLSLISDARKGGILYVELQTNAILLDRNYVIALKEAGLTSAFVSLLSHIPRCHDELAGLKGAFTNCIRGIRALLDVGISVTLNPVIAKETQGLVADYVDFVAANLQGVKAISFSAVQPHGRAASNLELLPDYAVLKEVMPHAIEKAKSHGIKPLNPFCGLPLCVGWNNSPDQCVEWQESLYESETNQHIGLQNSGNKTHGTPCYSCVFRSRCGGAWHAYWRVRNGSGIHPPQHLVNPFLDLPIDSNQSVVYALKGPVKQTYSELQRLKTPTRWLALHHFKLQDVERIAESFATDVAIMIRAKDISRPNSMSLSQIKCIRALQRALSSHQQLHLAASATSTFEAESIKELARRLGIRHVAVMRPT